MQFQAYSLPSNWAIVKVKAPSTSNRTPVHLCCVIDVSGSMESNNKLVNVKHSLHFLLDFLGPRDRITLITFSTHAVTLLSNMFITPLEKENIRARISIMAVQTSTNISAGIIECCESIKTGAEKQGIILLTDGEANRGVTDTKQLIALSNSISEANSTTISCIGYGTDHNTDLLKGIAANCSGSYYVVNNLEDVAKVLGDVLGSLMSCFYQQIHITFPTQSIVKTRYPLNNGIVLVGDLPAEMEAIILAEIPTGTKLMLKGFDLTVNERFQLECEVEFNDDPVEQINGVAHMLRFEVIELLDEFVTLKYKTDVSKEMEFIAKLDACLAKISSQEKQDHSLWPILRKELMMCKDFIANRITPNYNMFTQHGNCLGLMRGITSTSDDCPLAYNFSNGLQREMSDRLHETVSSQPLLPSQQESQLPQMQSVMAQRALEAVEAAKAFHVSQAYQPLSQDDLDIYGNAPDPLYCPMQLMASHTESIFQVIPAPNEPKSSISNLVRQSNY